MVQLGGFGDRRPAQLSGGQQQRVAVARALVFEPKLVLMDEPLGALDKQLREQMQLEIRRLHQRLGVTMVYVTHDQSEALTMSDRIAVFHRGRIQQLDGPEQHLRGRRPTRSSPASSARTTGSTASCESASGARCTVRLAGGRSHRRLARGAAARRAPPSRSRCARSGCKSRAPGIQSTAAADVPARRHAARGDLSRRSRAAARCAAAATTISR